MKVWLDWVPNHAAVENPWVKGSIPSISQRMQKAR